ncbi:hypothetical protein KPSA1_07175 [Pseudomonas syringae pv. actinidiae]|uniref:Uncharacterized protein n=1 Tax=Pseudomonas syringae pv. actinidiae TaxID=103796 RepID=A0A2V0QKL1_PSESF|nr:hypothetical protein KPSA1_07175 [Pseudomonas syringae pv. actinidiae]
MQTAATAQKPPLAVAWAQRAVTCWAAALAATPGAWSVQQSVAAVALHWVTTWATKAVAMIVAIAATVMIAVSTVVMANATSTTDIAVTVAIDLIAID